MFIDEIGGGTNISNLMLNKIKKYDDNIIIIDEAHNFFGNDSGDSLIKLRKLIKSTFILLTGSPITNTVSTLRDIIALITGEDFNLYVEIHGTKVFEKSLNSKGKEFVLQALKGRISYYHQDSYDLPKVYFEGKPIFIFPIVDCPMSKLQEENYKLVQKNVKNEMFLKYMMSASFVALGPIENFVNFNNYININEEKQLVRNLSIINGNFLGKELLDLNVSSKFKYFVNLKLSENCKRKGLFIFCK